MWNSRSCSDLREEPTDHLKLQPGDRLTLNFKQATLNAMAANPPSGVNLECDATSTHTGSQGAGGSQHPPEL